MATAFIDLDQELVAELMELVETTEPVSVEYTTFLPPYDHTAPQHPLVEVYALPGYVVEKRYTWYNVDTYEVRYYLA